MANKDEDKNIFRYQYLLVEIGTDIMRKIFDVKVGFDFVTRLSANNNKFNKVLQSLISAKIIKTDQAQHLPPIDNLPKSTNMDITLLTCLLRNVCGLRSQKDPLWRDPAPTDLSLEAELARLKECRNNLQHRPTVFISEADLTVIWDELNQILTGLNNVSKITNLSSLINDAKKMEIDIESKKRFDQTIKAWTEMDILLDRGIEELKLGQSEIKDGQSEISRGQSEIKDSQSAIKDSQSEIKHGQSEIKHGQSEIMDGQSAIKDCQSAIKDGQSEIKHGQSEIKHGQSEIKDGQSAIKDGQSAIIQGQSEIKDGQSAIKDNQSVISQGQSEIKDGQSAIKHGQSEIKHDQSEIKDGLSALKYGHSAIKYGQFEIKHDQSEIKDGQSAIKDGQSAIKDNQSAIIQGQSEIKHDQSEIKDGQSAIKDGQSAIKHGQSEIKDGQSELKDGQSEIMDGQSAIKDGQSEIIQCQSEIKHGQSELKDGQSEIKDSQSAIKDGQSEIIQGQFEIKDGQSDISQGQSEIKDGQSELKDGQAVLRTGQSEIVQGLSEMNHNLFKLNQGQSELKDLPVWKKSLEDVERGQKEQAERMQEISNMTKRLLEQTPLDCKGRRLDMDESVPQQRSMVQANAHSVSSVDTGAAVTFTRQLNSIIQLLKSANGPVLAKDVAKGTNIGHAAADVNKLLYFLEKKDLICKIAGAKPSWKFLKDCSEDDMKIFGGELAKIPESKRSKNKRNPPAADTLA